MNHRTNRLITTELEPNGVDRRNKRRYYLYYKLEDTTTDCDDVNIQPT